MSIYDQCQLDIADSWTRSSSGGPRTTSRKDSDSSDESPSNPSSKSSRSRPISRAPGACTHCKSLKIRCEFIPEENVCARCKAAGQLCVIRGRKKRRPAPTHEDLRKRSYAQDVQIQSLLRQLDEVRAFSDIRYWLQNAQAEAAALKQYLNQATHSSQTLPWKWNPQSATTSTMELMGRSQMSLEAMGISSEASITEMHIPVPGYGGSARSDIGILKHGLLSPSDVQSLFDLYFEHLHPCFCLLDPRIHTPQFLQSTSPFLFTAVCYVASRHWLHRPKLHQLILRYVEKYAADVLKGEAIDIEACQAYCLLAAYPGSLKRFADARNWWLIATAVRIAQEIGLDQPPPPECDMLVQLNRIQTWFRILCMDASAAIQSGGPPMVQYDDWLARTSHAWCRWQETHPPHVVFPSPSLEIFTIVINFEKTITQYEAQEVSDVNALALEYHDKLDAAFTRWKSEAGEGPPQTSLLCVREMSGIAFINAFKLIILGHSLHYAARRGVTPSLDLVVMAVLAAQNAVRTHVERSYPAGYLRYIFEPEFLYVTFSAAFIVHLIRTPYSSSFDPQFRAELLKDVMRLVQVYASPEVALDSTHPPAVYARFLASLLEHPSVGIDPVGGSTFAFNTDVASGSQCHYHPTSEQGPISSESSRSDMGFMFAHFVSNITPQDSPSTNNSASLGLCAPDVWSFRPFPSDQPSLDAACYATSYPR